MRAMHSYVSSYAIFGIAIEPLPLQYLPHSSGISIKLNRVNFAIIS